MIPLKDDNPTQRFPAVTVAIIAINCLAFLYQITLPAHAEQFFIYKYGYIPMEMTSFSEMTPAVPFPIWLSPFTSMFLHAGWLHLGGNMLYLWIFGNNVEDYLGPIRFLIFYIASGISAVFLFTIVNPHGTMPLIGASGAIAGVLGAYFVLWPRARVLTFIWFLFFIRLFWIPAVFILGYWIIIQLFMGLSSLGASEQGGIAWFAHIGGFAFGMLYIRMKEKRRVARSKVSIDESDFYNHWQ